jgi:hypothetical protein
MENSTLSWKWESPHEIRPSLGGNRKKKKAKEDRTRDVAFSLIIENITLVPISRYLKMQQTRMPRAHGPKTKALTSMLSRPGAPSGVLGSRNAVCGARPCTLVPGFNDSLSKHSRNNLSSFLMPER